MAAKKTDHKTRTIDNSLEWIQIDLLKGINNLDRLDFGDNPITGIFGPNCIGKTTILHALACSYAPINDDETNYKFPTFFLPSQLAPWKNSRFKIKIKSEAEPLIYKKSEDRWSPQYSLRPKRHVRYIGINTCTPLIETINQSSRLDYSESEAYEKEDLRRNIITSFSHVLNRQYKEISTLTYNVSHTMKGITTDIKYTELSMGAGEQRLLKILEELYTIGNGGLLLIDELDVLLHGEVLERYILELNRVCNKRDLQIVFTSHREQLLNYNNILNIRHLYRNEDGSKTYCQNTTTLWTWNQLTGERKDNIMIYVEDMFSQSIITFLVGKHMLTAYTKIVLAGSIGNLFTLCYSYLVEKENTGTKSLLSIEQEHRLFVLDGDRYVTMEEKKEQLNKRITGMDKNVVKLRKLCLDFILQYNIPQSNESDYKYNPEGYVVKLIKDLKPDQVNEPELRELYYEIKKIQFRENQHQYLNDAIRRFTDTGLSIQLILSRVIKLASISDEWSNFVNSVDESLARIAQQYRINGDLENNL